MSIVKRLCWMSSPISLAISLAAANAQVPEPPVRQNVDQSGVDVVLGTFNAAATDITIGPDGHQGLSYTRYWAQTGWRTSLVATISGNETNPIVSVGGSSEAFTVTGPGALTYTNNYGGGGGRW